MKLDRHLLIPPFKLVRKLPINFNEEDTKYFEQELTRFCDGVTYVSAKNIIVDLHKGVALNGFSVIPECLVSPQLIPSYNFGYAIRTLARVRKSLKNGPYLLAHTSYCEGYGHWMSDTIPRLYVMRDLLSDLKLILPSNYKYAFYLDSLLPFTKFKKDQIHYESSKVCWIQDIVIPAHVGPTFCNVRDEVLQEIRSLYHETFNVSTKEPWRKIYVSRAKTSRRFVINENEVVELLQNKGFEVVHFQDLSFKQQVHLSSESSIMVGLTGSGLNNMMFMNPGSKVLEFKMEGDYHNLHYFGFASGLQLDYFYQICKAYGEKRFEADFFVDIKKLNKNIENMLCCI